MTNRIRVLAAAFALALAACQQKPAGRCGADADCGYYGQHCSAGLCLANGAVGIGGACAVEMDCVAWASCAGGTCTADPGACGSVADCEAWQSCVAHVCQNPPGRCTGDPDCPAWQACSASYCILRPGMCATVADCDASWQVCDGGHACVTAAGRCSSAADCAAGRACLGDHTCSCLGAGDCGAWQVCSGGGTCQNAPGRCAVGADCKAWETCDGTHTCALLPGRCGTVADCGSWEVCDGTNTCAAAPGHCETVGTSIGCQRWETCGADHVCAPLPGRCGSDADCAAWESCTTNFCVMPPGRCVSNSDCPAGQTCDEGYVCGFGAFDPDGVIVRGGFPVTVPTVGAVAPVGSPTTPRLDVYPEYGVIRPDGRLVYLNNRYYPIREFRVFGQDALVWNDNSLNWEEPTDLLSNDDVFLTVSDSECFSLLEPPFVLQAGTGVLLYGCFETVGKIYYRDAANTVRVEVEAAFAWTESGYLLGGVVHMPTTVIDPGGAQTQVTGLPSGIIECARVTGDHFRVALVPDADPTRVESWTISLDGVATHEGTFAAMPAGFAHPYHAGSDWHDAALDANGVLYAAAETTSGVYLRAVVRRPLAPEASSVVQTGEVPPGYDENGHAGGIQLFMQPLPVLYSGP